MTRPRTRPRLMLLWAGRDLLAHWPKVVAIALVIAIGTGGYAGLTSTVEWRRVSYDLNYRSLAMYDLQVDLAPGSSVAEGRLTGLLADLPSAEAISGFEERLIVPTQVDASTGGDDVIVRGEIVGSDFADGGPDVGRYHPFTGRALSDDDNGAPVVMVERNFARFYDLDDTGTVTVSGGRRLEFVGQAASPEYFTVAPEGAIYMSEATFAALFTTLDTAQDLAGAPNRVNNLVLTVDPTAERDQIAKELEQALASLPVGATVSSREEDLAFKGLDSDIEQDKALFDFLAVLLLAGAVGAAFNLITRLADQQRREIGIGMALGVRPWVLAFRPLLVSIEVALLGVAFGVGVGLAVGEAMGAVFADLVPLPVWDTSFQTAVFARVAVIGLVAPVAAAVLPAWRATRVTPVEAIRPQLTAKGARLQRGNSHRSTLTVMPVRNLRRTPRRTVLTLTGVAAAVTVLMGFVGIMDSVFAAIDTAESEAVGDVPGRIMVALDGPSPAAGGVVAAIEAADSVGELEVGLRLPAVVRTDEGEIDLFIEMVDFDGGTWAPTLTAGAAGSERGVILSDRAAADLGVGIGDKVTLRHPIRQGLASYALIDSELPLVATHPNPVRALAYMDAADADVFDLAGVANMVYVLPSEGASTVDVQRDLFTTPGVASAQAITAVTEAVRDAFDEFLEVVQVMVAVVLVLVAMIAFNTAAINLDARGREHATMFAFGVPVRTALRMAVIENLIMGIAATVVGLGAGLGMVWWMTHRVIPATLPEFGLEVAVRAGTLIWVSALSIGAVTVAPLLTIRRMRRMDVAGTLRFVE